MTAPRAAYGDVWAELTGYVQQARDDGEQIDPDELLGYLAELKGRALAPIRDWLKGMGKPMTDDDLGNHEYDPAWEIICDEIATWVRISVNTCLAGLGDFGDEPAQRRIVDQIRHLHLAEPHLPASAAIKRLRDAGLAAPLFAENERRPRE